MQDTLRRTCARIRIIHMAMALQLHITYHYVNLQGDRNMNVYCYQRRGTGHHCPRATSIHMYTIILIIPIIIGGGGGVCC